MAPDKKTQAQISEEILTNMQTKQDAFQSNIEKQIQEHQVLIQNLQQNLQVHTQNGEDRLKQYETHVQTILQQISLLTPAPSRVTPVSGAATENEPPPSPTPPSTVPLSSSTVPSPPPVFSRPNSTAFTQSTWAPPTYSTITSTTFQNSQNPNLYNQNSQNPNLYNQNSQNPNLYTQNLQNPNFYTQHYQNTNPSSQPHLYNQQSQQYTRNASSSQNPYYPHTGPPPNPYSETGQHNHHHSTFNPSPPPQNFPQSPHNPYHQPPPQAYSFPSQTHTYGPQGPPAPYYPHMPPHYLPNHAPPPYYRGPVVEPEIALQAITGKTNAASLRLCGTLKGKRVLFLIDTGSTHNFLDPHLAEKLQLPFPQKVLATRRRMKKGRQVLEGLIHWHGQRVEDATWEPLYKLRNQFPHLEDKVSFQEEGSCNDPTSADQHTSQNNKEDEEGIRNAKEEKSDNKLKSGKDKEIITYQRRKKKPLQLNLLAMNMEKKMERKPGVNSYKLKEEVQKVQKELTEVITCSQSDSLRANEEIPANP